MEKPKTICPKIIGVHELERTNPATKNWWWNKFKGMEERSTRPFYKRMQYLEKTFSKDLLTDLINAGIEVFEESPEDIDDSKLKSTAHLVRKPTESKLRPVKTASKKTALDVEPSYTNPYLNFMRKSEEEARIWREKRTPTLDEYHLVDKAIVLQEKIASDFDNWFSQVGSSKKSEIDKETILTIFELILSYPIATSLSRSIKEVGSVPEVTAKFLGFPQTSEPECVRQQIRRDIRAGTQKPRTIAFNKTLPKDLRRKPFTENLKAKWFEFELKHQDLATMAAVWRGITDLYTTRAFCLWLLDHPNVEPPSFLVREGLLNRNILLKSALDFTDSDETDWGIGATGTSPSHLRQMSVSAEPTNTKSMLVESSEAFSKSGF